MGNYTTGLCLKSKKRSGGGKACTVLKYASMGVVAYSKICVRSSPVERVPDKNEVQGPTPCARTSG